MKRHQATQTQNICVQPQPPAPVDGDDLLVNSPLRQLTIMLESVRHSWHFWCRAMHIHPEIEQQMYNQWKEWQLFKFNHARTKKAPTTCTHSRISPPCSIDEAPSKDELVSDSAPLKTQDPRTINPANFWDSARTPEPQDENPTRACSFH